MTAFTNSAASPGGERIETYDYVIIGAGSAGCVLADRLTASGEATVLLIEAGDSDDDELVKIPLLWAGLLQGPVDWNYMSDPELALGGRRLFLPRGKMLGGSSSLNAMIYVRGTHADYDNWNDLPGVTNWAYDDVLPYFRKSEHNAEFDDEFHGQGGPLHVTRDRWISDAFGLFTEAATALGVQWNDDYNGADQEGITILQGTVRDGRRCSTADAFLRPALDRENLTVKTSALVHRILFDGDTATGVEFEIDGGLHHVDARREVVLSAGTYNSPQILMLSGIGPRDELEQLKIPVVRPSSHVGQHLQDHPLTVMHWRTSLEDTVDDVSGPEHREQWLRDGTGKYSSFAAEGTIFWKSDPKLASPDFQINFVPGWFWDHGFRRPTGAALSVALSYNGPTSTGSVTLRNADPHEQPSIVSNLLGDPHETAALLKAMDFADEIMGSEPISTVVTERVNPGESLTTSDERLKWARNDTQHMYHPTSTCRIGTSQTGVVDAELRVHGIRGLRVVDASVMPRIPSGNTNAATIMIAERAADLIARQTAS